MKATATVEEINSVQRRVKIKIPSERVNKAFDHQFNQLRQKANVKGFRPGKTPINILRKLYNASVAYDVIDELINEHLFTAIKEGGVKPISRPFVESTNPPVENQEYELSAIVDVLPKFDLGDKHKNLEVSYTYYEKPEGAVDQRLDRIAREHARAIPLPEDAVCEIGHLAKISCVASRDGVVFESLTFRESPLEVGKNRLPAQELEDALLGMKATESKDLIVNFKEERLTKLFGDQGILFKLSLHELKRLEIPALDDELAKDLHFDSFVALKDAVGKEIDAFYERMNRESMQKALLEELQNRVSFEVPPSLTDQVIDSIIDNMQFKSESEYKQALADPEFRKQLLPEAKMRAKNTLLLQELIKTEALSVSDDEVRERLRKEGDETDSEKQKRDIEKTLKEQGNELKEQLFFDKALHVLEGNARLTKVPPASY